MGTYGELIKVKMGGIWVGREGGDKDKHDLEVRNLVSRAGRMEKRAISLTDLSIVIIQHINMATRS